MKMMMTNNGFKPLRSRCTWALLDTPFVPNNLISTQESPVPLVVTFRIYTKQSKICVNSSWNTKGDR